MNFLYRLIFPKMTTYIEQIPLSKTKREVIEELTDFLMTFKFVVEEKIVEDNFKLIKFRNDYTFYNAVLANIYVVKTDKLTEERYNLMLEQFRNINTITKNNYKGAIIVVFVDEYNEIFEKYLKEFFYVHYYSGKGFPRPTSNLGVCFKEKQIYIGSLNEDTQYGRGIDFQKDLSNLVKSFNEGTFKFQDKINEYKASKNSKKSKQD